MAHETTPRPLPRRAAARVQPALCSTERALQACMCSSGRHMVAGGTPRGSRRHTSAARHSLAVALAAASSSSSSAGAATHTPRIVRANVRPAVAPLQGAERWPAAGRVGRGGGGGGWCNWLLDPHRHARATAARRATPGWTQSFGHLQLSAKQYSPSYGPLCCFFFLFLSFCFFFCTYVRNTMQKHTHDNTRHAIHIVQHYRCDKMNALIYRVHCHP